MSSNTNTSKKPKPNQTQRKTIYMSNILPTLQRRKTENISFNVRNETTVSILSPLIHYNASIVFQSSKARERNRRNTNGKIEFKLSIIADNIILFLKAPNKLH
jgi:hypothetical protein